MQAVAVELRRRDRAEGRRGDRQRATVRHRADVHERGLPVQLEDAEERQGLLRFELGLDDGNLHVALFRLR